jgi:hypothetical protein
VNQNPTSEESPMIRVVQIPLPKDRLRAVSKEERSLFLLLGYAANQITMFQKLLIFSSNRTPSEAVEQRISVVAKMLTEFILDFSAASPGLDEPDEATDRKFQNLTPLKKRTVENASKPLLISS